MKTSKTEFLRLTFYAGLICLIFSCKKDKPVTPPAPPPSTPELSFTATVDANSSPVKVELNNTSANSSNVTWTWSFGDDSISTQKSPVHYYYSPGTYTITLLGKLNGNTLPAVTKTITIDKDPMLKAWYKLDGSNFKTDASGSMNDIRNAYGSNFIDVVGHKGIINTALDMSGQTANFQLPDGLFTSQLTNSNSVARTSISMWVNFDNLTGRHGLLYLSNPNSGQYVPALFTIDKQLRGMFWDNPEANFIPMNTGSSTLSVGKWYHIVLAGGEDGQSLYVDGQKIASRNKAITHLQMDKSYMGVGVVFANGEWFNPQPITGSETFYFDGKLDDIRIYNKRLSDAEVLALSKE